MTAMEYGKSEFSGWYEPTDSSIVLTPEQAQRYIEQAFMAGKNDERVTGSGSATSGGKRSVDKYKMFRNFMANELGISKADIESWTRESVTQTAERYLNGIDLESCAERFLNDLRRSDATTFRAQLNSALTNVLREKYSVSVEVKG